jgi:pyroglutamyl-peptidase
MDPKILLTSFDVWEPHQTSNASDDLLHELITRNLLPENVYFLRKIPVDFQLAALKVIVEIDQVEPDIVVCCGMAEKRSLLTVELNGKFEETIVQTSIDVNLFLGKLAATEISEDAGKFVCNYLYYSTLKYIQDRQLDSRCLFLHVPVLNQTNVDVVVSDVASILQILQFSC